MADDSNLNDLDYDQHIFAAYASYGRCFGKTEIKLRKARKNEVDDRL